MQLPEHATLEQAAALAQTVPAAVAAGTGPLQVDASQLKAFDSSTIALLLHTHRLAQAAGRGLVVTGAPAQLAQLAQLYGVEALLGLTPPVTLAAANPAGALSSAA
jgi:phospholipid transport system transporter-binding protein